ncbi:ABC transporter ATP-binding protein [Desulfosarcina ovata]|uniref:ABC transporter domain-containing protein n=1 Tax=Desulfosarcina ovata subsp. ovata TaxID=2752305 RepID=A0A5K8A4M6_9BACT|nr:ABC transporter ATP-binding protein [Desulfosarcina ovata]BBO87533.1 hypothetical protein DSCOOX_07130 [Desulfosarcina ovata subsp. ovata]
MIEIKHVYKKIQGQPVLEDVSLKIDKQRILALIGPSGCGKTTLLRLLAGLDRPDAGTITINGVRVSDSKHLTPPHQRRLGMIFQDLALWPHMTARQQLEYVIQKQKKRNLELTKKIGRLLDAVNLNGHSDRYPHQLSGGEQQRLAIVRSLAQEPEYLLMDEPFSNLDPILKTELQAFISSVQAETKIGIVYVTHNIKDLERITDRVAIMQKGRLIQVGDKREVVKSPVNQFVERMLQG